MKTKITFLAVLGAAVLAIGVTTMVLISQPNKSADKPASASTGSVQGATSTEIKFTATRGKSVLEQLKDHAKVEVKQSSYGAYVDSINGTKGGTNNKYWMYYVNGELANIGAADYITVGGEVIEWRFE